MDYYCYDEQFRDIQWVLESIDDRLAQLVEMEMDKKIKQIQKDTKKLEKEEGALLKADKKRDKFVEAGKKALKNK